MIGRLLIVFTAATLLSGGALVMMNYACESSHHSWCASEDSIPFYAKTGH
jgi:hypothetical protein